MALCDILTVLSPEFTVPLQYFDFVLATLKSREFYMHRLVFTVYVNYSTLSRPGCK